MMVKHRRRAAWLVMRVANVFFRLARNPVEAIVSDAEWRMWEVDCFRLLHGPEFAADMGERGTPIVSVLPGVDLSRHLVAGTLQPAQLASAGAELRRVHGLRSQHYGGGWSHGDSHSGNFLFEEGTGRARLVDFEMRHRRDVPEARRHADDLLILLQDVCGRCARDAWLPLSEAFLAGYGRGDVIALLENLLHVGRGISRLWWGVRTTWMRRRELELRMGELRSVLPGRGQLRSASAVQRG